MLSFVKVSVLRLAYIYIYIYVDLVKLVKTLKNLVKAKLINTTQYSVKH